MLSRSRVLRLVVAALFAGALVEAIPVLSQPAASRTPIPAPAAPTEYNVVIRYRIEGARNDRLLRYFKMQEALTRAGFQRDAGDEPSELEPLDTKHTLLKGTLARSAVARVLNTPDVQAVLLAPKAKALPGKEESVRVEIRLPTGLPLAQQRDLHAQAAQALNTGGFGEAVGYDTRQNSRILGQITTSKLVTLLQDLRRQPAAWPLLPKSLLADLRKTRGGLDFVERIADEWMAVPAAKKILLDLVQQWQAFPAAVDFARNMPANILDNPVLLQETQIRHFLRHPESADLFNRLFEEVRKSDQAPELMDVLLSRLEASGLIAELPVLFRTSPPVRIVEAQPDWPLPQVTPPSAEIPKGQEKFTADLRALLADADQAGKARRFEVILRDPISERADGWTDKYASLAVEIEGKLGGIVIVNGPPSEAVKIAEFPDVMVVRLPRKADEARQPEKELTAECQMGERKVPSLASQYASAGRLQSVVLIGADFRGWEGLKGDGLPARTRLLDLTAEREREIQSIRTPAEEKELGVGTKAAVALARLAGTIDLVLVKIDPETPYMVDYVARLTSGLPETSLALRARLRDLSDDRESLETRNTRLLEERARVLADFRPDAEKTREEYFKKQAKLDEDRKDFAARQARFLAHEKVTNEVRKMRTVWNTLSWDEGHPLFTSGSLSRYLDDHPYPGIWLQSRGGDLRRIWTGLFRDDDFSGSMDLLPPGETLPAGRWNPDLGFLAWKNDKGERVLDLPAGATLRLAVQWKEVHDADLARMGEDFYLEPLSKLSLEVFQQLDPLGKTQPADDLAPVAQSSGVAQRLLKLPRFAIYEQWVEFKVVKAGRYLIRVTGHAPESTRPKKLPTIPAAREVAEMRPRIVLRTITGAGEALFEDPPLARPLLPMPADAVRAVPVGVK